MDLIIVESPTKARTLTKFLGSGYQITASMGHIRDLPQKKLGINIEKDFEPEYEISKDKKEKVAELQKLAKMADKIILATDPDREGEAISWHISQILNSKPQKQSLQRITFHEITEKAIKEALQNPG
ncbi:toprim domain-containing protein, partial [Candidatus Microgenomates bacterium]|nr:toprim domain-containing protein [Candidatus Microgenomates bacterium]